MLQFEIKTQDTWIFYELCGESLGNSLYDLKGEGYINGERVYRIHYKPFYLYLRKDPKLLKRIVFELAHALYILSDNKIVHSDVKTENILIKTSKNAKGEF